MRARDRERDREREREPTLPLPLSLIAVSDCWLLPLIAAPVDRHRRLSGHGNRYASSVATRLASICMAMGTQSDRLPILASPRASPKMKIVPIS